MRALPPSLYIGCSGYYYPYWKNRFYPVGLQPKNWLVYYASIFNTVELNGTFYRLPKLSHLQKYASVTPDDFTFSVKVSRHITHYKKLKDCGNEILEFSQLMQEGLTHKLSCLLFQFPPSFHYHEDNLKLVLQNIPHTANHVVECRHQSWWNETVQTELSKANITFCNVDFPGLNTYTIQTTPLFYYRFHGNPELFKSSYSHKQLLAFKKQIPNEAKQLHIYFNNTYYEAGYNNALDLKNIFSG